MDKLNKLNKKWREVRFVVNHGREIFFDYNLLMLARRTTQKKRGKLGRRVERYGLSYQYLSFLVFALIDIFASEKVRSIP